MAQITRTGNFSVSSVEFGVSSGTNIADTQSTAILTLIPDAGFTITAADFTYTSGPSQVESVTFAQSGANVVATVTFAADAVMPNNNLDIPLCIAGDSGLVEYSLAGEIEVIASGGNVTPATSNIAYTATGNEGDEVQVFSQTITADSGYYFPIEPTGSLNTGDPNSYLFSTSLVTDNEGNITAKTFTGDYTFGSSSVSGDIFTIVANAEEVPVVIREITSYTISTANIRGVGETRQMTVFGNAGAEFSLTVVNEDGTSIHNIANQTISGETPSIFNIVFPSVTDNDDYDFVLTGDLADSFDTPAGQPSTFTLNQYIDINLTFQLTTTNPDLTPGATEVFQYVADTDLEPGDTNYNFSGELTVIGTIPIIEETTPLPSDFTNLIASANGGTDTVITTVTSTLSVSNLVYTINFTGVTEQTGIQDVVSTLNLDNYIATNTAPVGIEYTYYVDEDVAETLDLDNTFSDADGDTLTITINSTPINGTLYTDSTKTTELGIDDTVPAGNDVYYEPDLNYNGDDSFQATASDGSQDSNLTTIPIVVASINDLPIIDNNQWETTGTATINGASTPITGGFNAYVFEAGDSFSAIATAVDVEDAATDLTWSLVSQNTATGSGETTVPTWVTGTTNSDGTFTISSTSVVDGNFVFYIKVEDTDGGVDYQIVSISGIVPTVNSYFKFFFDSSGSMGTTEARLDRDLLNVSIADEIAYEDNTYLRYYLQDFYATGLTYAEEETQGIAHNNATNGVDEYNAKVSLVTSSTERIYEQLHNESAGITYGSSGAFPNADSVVIGTFSDESSNTGTGNYYGTGGATNPQPDYTAANLKALALTDVNTLRNTINNLVSVKGTGFYRGIYFSVDSNPQYGTTQDEMWNDSIVGIGGFAAPIGGDPDENNLSTVTAYLTGEIGTGPGQTPIIDDGNTTNGYYTEKVIDQLIALGYNIPAYGS